MYCQQSTVRHWCIYIPGQYVHVVMMKMSKSNVIMSLFLPESRKRQVESAVQFLLLQSMDALGHLLVISVMHVHFKRRTQNLDNV